MSKIKPENLYGKTFGRITYEVQKYQEENFETYESTNKLDFVDQQKVDMKPVSGVRCLSKTLKISNNFRDTLKGKNQ